MDAMMARIGNYLRIFGVKGFSNFSLKDMI